MWGGASIFDQAFIFCQVIFQSGPELSVTGGYLTGPFALKLCSMWN